MSEKMKFTIITGLSGAGKTLAMHAMEDIGYYCVDNLPPELISTFYDLCNRSEDRNMKMLAVVVDTRVGSIDKLFSALENLSGEGGEYKILFLDAKKDVLESRYKQTRRKHPLADKFSGSISKAIDSEVQVLEKLKNVSDYIIDSSYISPYQLKERVATIFLGDNLSGMSVTAMSFGFKYGIPSEADVVFDVRCLPNPFYIPGLKNKTGNDKEVFDYVMKSDCTPGLFERIVSYIDYCLPLYADEGKSQLVVAIGCTGGKHRSVTLANALREHLNKNKQKCNIYHRDINKE